MADARGYRIEAIFRGGVQIDSTARYTTDNERIQKTLESSALFNREFYIESVQEPTPVVEPVKDAPEEIVKVDAEPTDIKDIRRFRNLVEMKSAMKELGIAIPANATYAAAKAAAKKEGYDFQIQK